MLAAVAAGDDERRSGPTLRTRLPLARVRGSTRELLTFFGAPLRAEPGGRLRASVDQAGEHVGTTPPRRSSGSANGLRPAGVVAVCPNSSRASARRFLGDGGRRTGANPHRSRVGRGRHAACATASQVRVALSAMPCSDAARTRPHLREERRPTVPTRQRPPRRRERRTDQRPPVSHRSSTRPPPHRDACASTMTRPNCSVQVGVEHAGHEHDVGAAEKSREPVGRLPGLDFESLTTPRAAASSRAGRSSGPEPMIRELHGPRPIHLRQHLDGVANALLGNKPPAERENHSSSSSD